MPQVKKIDKLPETVRDELNEKLKNNGFGGLKDLEAWLKTQGHQISHETIGKHGRDLKARIGKRMEQAFLRVEILKAMRGVSADEKAVLMEAGEAMAMDQIMDLLEEMPDWGFDKRALVLPKIVRAIADLSRSAIGSAKWKKDFEEEALRKALDEATKAAASAAKAEGVSEKGIFRIREALGMVAA
jgi:hypothetical protein